MCPDVIEGWFNDFEPTIGIACAWCSGDENNAVADPICGIDSNADGSVGVDDLLALLASYGQSTSHCVGVGGR